MKFGLAYDLRNPQLDGPRRLPDLYAQTLEQITFAEELGFDDMWVSEHHMKDDDYMPSTTAFCGAIAARTQRVGIGTFITVAPLHHPLKLAEDCAVLDNLSDGRFSLGVGAGYHQDEFAAFGVDYKKRGAILGEVVEILIKCWTEEAFSYHGEHFQLEDISCRPFPVQKQIPLWFGVNKGKGIERAGRLADGLLGSEPERYWKWIDAIHAAGRNIVPHAVGGPTWVFCTEDPERAWHQVKKYAMYQINLYAKWAEATKTMFPKVPDTYEELEALGLCLVATPETIINRVRADHALAPFDHQIYWAIWPGMDVTQATSSLELLAAKVMPELRDLGEKPVLPSPRSYADTSP